MDNTNKKYIRYIMHIINIKYAYIYKIFIYLSVKQQYFHLIQTLFTL